MLCGFARVLGSISTTPLLETQSSRASEAPGRIPCWQGKTQGICRFSRFLRKSGSKTSANAMVCRRIPYASAQGIISREQGIHSALQGICANSIRALRRVQFHSVVDKKIINAG